MKFSNYRNLYGVQKTLRFELRPIGETLKYIEERDIITEDELKYNDSFKVKEMLDELYINISNEILTNFQIPSEDLNEYFNNFINKETLDNINKKLKTYIKDTFNKEGLANRITSAKVLIDLKEHLISENREEDLDILEKFMKFATYFDGFFTNRRYIFTGDAEGSISYRLIEENLSIFTNNLLIFSEIIKSDLSTNLNDYIDLEEFNDILHYNNIMNQENIDKYNNYISGTTISNELKEKGINEIINLYNQQNKTKHPLLKQLNKLILSDKESLSFRFEIIESDKEVFDLINAYLTEVKFNNYFIENVDYNNIYIENQSNIISSLSKKIFDNWSEIQNKLYDYYEKNINNKTNQASFNDKRKKYFSNIDSYSLFELNSILDKDIYKRLNDLSNQYIQNIKLNITKFNNIDEYNIKNLKNQDNQVKVIKDLLDSIKEYQMFLKPFYLPNELNSKDPDFYQNFDKEYLLIKEIIPLYNKVRNYITSKPYSTQKFKFNFNTTTFLSGWDINKESDNLGVILRKINLKTNDYSYYLGILHDKKIFKTESKKNVMTKNYYEKMEYKLFPGANKQLPRIFISAKEYNEKLNQEFKDSYKAKKHTKDNLDKEFLKEYIEYMQLNLKERYSNDFTFNFRKPSDYKQVDEFYRDVEDQGYNVKFTNYPEEYINKCINEGKLYLFEIYSKDFSEHSKGLPNNQTIYFKNLFSEENLKKKYVRLQGGAEVFYRRKSVEYKETHLANIPIKNKSLNNKREYSTFTIPLIKDKRYTMDKFLFHFPITLNAVNANIKNINPRINENIDEFEHVIGIDRGERNLIYIVITDLNGNIVKQRSLNEIISDYNNHKVDYHKLLDNREKQLLDERQTWKKVNTIKELKEGYISQVVHVIKEYAIKYNAIIVLENLNYGFKNSRKKVEKQVYQKFETQLINKFNYIIDKKEPTTYLNALQLTNPLKNLNDLGSQTGIIFYIPAWNTSNIDPSTGFVNLFFGLRYENETKAKEFISRIKEIRYNQKYFEFDINYDDFNNNYKNSKREWTLCTFGNRITNQRDSTQNNAWVSKEIDLTTEFHKLFSEYNVDFNNLKHSVLNVNKPKFYESFIRLFKLMVQLRNSEIGTSVDYISSPIKNSNNEFFDSRKEIDTLPKDADANGAFNIARKGLMLIKNIKDTPAGGKINYQITNEEYLQKLQKM